MTGDRLTLFCDTGLAERIERVEAQLVARASETARRRRADTAGFDERSGGWRSEACMPCEPVRAPRRLTLLANSLALGRTRVEVMAVGSKAPARCSTSGDRDLLRR
jgi:hypothetical protein